MTVLRGIRASFRRLGVAGLVVVACSLALPAELSAQPTAVDQRATAQALFEDAVKLMSEGRLPEACPKLEEVVRLQPGGHGAKVTLADCYERSGRLASAWTTYGQAEAAMRLAGQNERADDAHAKGAALQPRLSRITIIVPETSRAPGLEVVRDGVPVGPVQWGTALPIDGGAHVVEAKAPGKQPWSTTTTVPSDLGNMTVTIPPLSALVAATPPTPGPARPAPQAPPAAIDDASIPVWVWVVGGLGVAAAGVGVGFRVDQVSAEDHLIAACGPSVDACPSVDVYDPADDNARKNRDFGLFVGLTATGGIAVGTAVVGALVSALGGDGGAEATGPRVAPYAGDGSAGLLMSARF